MELGIGPLSFSLTGELPPSARSLAADYPPPADPAGRYTLHFTHEGGPPFLPLPPPYSGALHRMEVEEQPDDILCTSYFFQAWLPQGVAAAGGPAARAVWRDAPPEHEPLIVHNILRNWAAYLLPGRRIVLLHAGGVVMDGRAVLFTGRSGAGKSTATAFCGARFPSLGDDIVGLDFRAARPAVLPIPCFNPKAPPSAALRPWPLGMVNTLKQAPHHRLQRLSAPEALTTLISQSPFINVRSACLETGLDLLACQLRELPVYRLELMKNNGFIELLQAELAHFPALQA